MVLLWTKHLHRKTYMKNIILIAAVLMMAVLSSCETREQKKYKKFYFEKITADMAMTEYYLTDTLNTLPKDSLIERLHELNRIYFKEIR